MSKKTSEEWYKEIKATIEILDPDGWDRSNFEYSFNEEEITKEEFDRRLANSTVLGKLTGNIKHPQPSEAELWKEVQIDILVAETKKRDAANRMKWGIVDSIQSSLNENLSKKYSITLREEVPEAVQMLQWASGMYTLLEDEFYLTSDKDFENPISWVDLYKEFQLYKKQKL